MEQAKPPLGKLAEGSQQNQIERMQFQLQLPNEVEELREIVQQGEGSELQHQIERMGSELSLPFEVDNYHWPTPPVSRDKSDHSRGRRKELTLLTPTTRDKTFDTPEKYESLCFDAVDESEDGAQADVQIVAQRPAKPQGKLPDLAMYQWTQSWGKTRKRKHWQWHETLYSLNEAFGGLRLMQAAGEELQKEAAGFKHKFLCDGEFCMTCEKFVDVLQNLNRIVPEVLAAQEAEKIFELTYIDDGKKEDDSESILQTRGKVMTYEMFSDALHQVGQACAKKLTNLENDGPQSLTDAAIFQKLQCTCPLVRGLKQRHRAAIRIRGTTSMPPHKSVASLLSSAAESLRQHAKPARCKETNATSDKVHLPRIHVSDREDHSNDLAKKRGKDALESVRARCSQDNVKLQVTAARLALAQELAQVQVLKEKVLIGSRKAKGNEMTLVLLEHARHSRMPEKAITGTQFTCITGTTVHIPTLQASRCCAGSEGRGESYVWCVWRCGLGCDGNYNQ
jgi:hypothetical protein